MKVFLFIAAILCQSHVFAAPSYAVELIPGAGKTINEGDSLNDNPYALVAGGSKGIGLTIAEALAKRHFNLILIARHYDSLFAAKQRLENRYGIHVELLIHDLSEERAATEIANWCTQRNIRLKVLCNVAGLGGARDFLALTIDSLRYMINLNVESCVILTARLLPLLKKNAPSYILNVASMAGLAPIPSKNLYAATKSAVLYFSYGLHYQLKPMKISVSCLAPGPVFTKPIIEKETRKNLGWFGLKMAVPPKRVGEIAVKKMMKGRTLIVPGTLAKATSIFLRAIPKRWAAAVYNKVGTK